MSHHVRMGMRAIWSALLCFALAGCAVQAGGGSAGGIGGGDGGVAGMRCTAELQGGAGDDVRAAVETVQQYWGSVFAGQGLEFDPVGRVCGYLPGGGATCGGQELVPNNASYCPADDLISYDARWVSAAFDQVGDAFVFYLIGHEYAHAIQGPSRLGIEHRFTIQHELQADCMAGAYMGDQIRSGRLQLEQGDTDELLTGLAAVADPEGSPWFGAGAHGTVQQRTSRFSAGFEDSLSACDL